MTLCQLLLHEFSYGKVLLVRHKASRRLYAMKVLKKASLFLKTKHVEHTKAERQILEEVKRRPHFIRRHIIRDGDVREAAEHPLGL